MIKSYFVNRKHYTDFHKFGKIITQLHNQSMAMNNSKLFKPSYKEVENFVAEFKKIKSEFGNISVCEMGSLTDIFFQKYKNIRDYPLDTLTHCEVFSEKLMEICDEVNESMPFVFREGSQGFMMIETLGISFLFFIFMVFTAL